MTTTPQVEAITGTAPLGLASHARTPDQFAALWHRAKVAAQVAAIAQDAKLGEEQVRGFDCGFAWLEMPGNMPFARWLKKEGSGLKGYPSGVHVWYSKLHSVPTQSISVHEAAVRAARDVLAHGLQTTLISAASRLD